jgi:hypothetical protein
MIKTLPQDFSELLNLLNEKKVDYLLIGGYAVSYYGFPRYTGDIDFWIRVNEKNVRKIVGALVEFGFASPDLKVENFLKPHSIVRLGNPPLCVEFINTIDGVEFEECFNRKEVAIIDGVEINIIAKMDLLKNKKASGRPKDLNDLENLA